VIALEQKVVERINQLMNDKVHIRNIGTSAHIHHGKCVAPDTRLSIIDGSVRSAQSLFDQATQTGKLVRENEEEIVYDVSQQNITVFSLNKETGSLENKNIQYAWKLRGGRLVKVKLRNGFEVATTPEHKFIALEDMAFVEKEAAELKLGDRVVCARHTKVETNEHIKSEILCKLAYAKAYVVLEESSGSTLKSLILKEGIKKVALETNASISYKSFYHGVWQHRYLVKDLLLLCERFDFNVEEMYDKVKCVSFRVHSKSTLSMKLPQDFTSFFYLAGLFVGDGSGHRFVAGKKELADQCISTCVSLGINAKLKKWQNKTPEVHANKSLLYLLHALFDYPLKQKSHHVRVSDLLFKASKKYSSAFIAGYFDCDGTVERARSAISLTSVSPQMLRDMQLLLLRFSCLSIIIGDTLYITGVSARNFTNDITFKLSSKQEKAIHLAKKVQGSIVSDTIPFSHKQLLNVRKVSMASLGHHYYKYEQEVLTPLLDTVLELKQKFAEQQQETRLFDRLTTGDLAFIEVVSLEQSYSDTVYDFTVPEHKNFVAEGMIIHNTAFSDNLIAAAGMMSQTLAGDALVLNFRQDEIDRCMTIDSANVSMVHKHDDSEYLINLIDTPGHVDFGGDVTRAMRAIDGTVLLVCASEGIMPQTETVLRQALRERVKPVLFINKVDRLITELKMAPDKIQERFVKIITQVNQLIREIAEPEYGEKWQVNVADGSVAFGSARENWALSIPFMKKKGVSFKDVVDIYHTNEGDARFDKLFQKAPLFEVILDMVVKHMPNPLEAQVYRIPKIWHGEVDSALGKSLLTCDPKGKIGFVVTKITIEQQVGEIAYGRLYSGTIARGMEVYLNRAKQSQRIQQIFIANGAKRELVESVSSGNILGIVGLKAWVGETLTTEPDTPFEEITHIFEPVISKSIEPARPSDLPKLIEVLRKVSKEDPTVKVEINEETGENIISGMGELHLEIVENRIKTEKGLEVKTGAPIVVYREAITRLSPEFEGKSPNKHNKFYMKVQPVPEELAKLIKATTIPSGRFKKRDDVLIQGLRGLGWDAKEANRVKAIHNGNVFLDETRGEVHMIEVIEMVLDMFENVMEIGPLAKEPCVNVMVTLTDIKLHEDAIHRGPAQVYPAVRDSIRGAMMQAGPVLYEPLQILRIEAPVAWMGTLSALITSKRGQLMDVTQEGSQTVIKGKLPVGEMFGWSADLRSATEGRGNFSLIDQEFQRVPNELQQKIRNIIVQRKGLQESQLGA